MRGRVLRVVTRLNRGGPLRQLRSLVPALAARGWTGPVVVGRTEAHEPDGTADLRDTGADIVSVRALRRGPDPAADGRALRAILGAIRRFDPDLIHTHLGKAGALGRIAARLTRTPVVHTFHGHHLTAPWPFGPIARSAERALSSLTSAAVCLTPLQKRDLLRVFPARAATRLHVIAPGIDVDALRRAASADSAGPIGSARGEGGHALFVWAGRFVAVKDPLGLVRAVSASERKFRVVMLGEGPLRSRVRREIRRRGLEAVIACPGAVAEPAPWIAASDAVVLSSRSEGAPIVVLEAKALSRPAIVTSVGGVPDLVEHGHDGWWVAPGSEAELARALDLFAADRGLARRLGMAAGRGVRERFGGERLAEETAALYERVRATSG